MKDAVEAIEDVFNSQPMTLILLQELLMENP